MRLKIGYLLIVVLVTATALSTQVVSAQTPAPVPMSAPNALLIYDKTTVALINTSPAAISLAGVSFMRAGGVVTFNAVTLMPSLTPGHCIQVWTSAVQQNIGKPPECAFRDRWQRLWNQDTYFWIANYDGEPFRPQLRGSALVICRASFGAVERCPFYIPQDNDAMKPWAVLDPASGLPMPAGMDVAYDANQLWIGNLTPDTVLPTGALRFFYTANGKGTVWTPAGSTWDSGTWDGRGLLSNQCLVLYQDVAKVSSLLPCTPIARAQVADPFWRLTFDVMGPREERRITCGSDKPITGPVLCLISA